MPSISISFDSICALPNKQSRSKCLPFTEQSSHTQGHSTTITTTTSYNNQYADKFLQTPTIALDTQSWIRTDRLLSEANSLNLPQIPMVYTMTKAMDSFSEAHNNTVTQNSMNGFDELMTPIIGKFFFNEKFIDDHFLEFEKTKIRIKNLNPFHTLLNKRFIVVIVLIANIIKSC